MHARKHIHVHIKYYIWTWHTYILIYFLLWVQCQRHRNHGWQRVLAHSIVSLVPKSPLGSDCNAAKRYAILGIACVLVQSRPSTYGLEYPYKKSSSHATECVYRTHTLIMYPVCVLHTHSYYVSSVRIAHTLLLCVQCTFCTHTLIMCPVCVLHTHSYYVSSVGFAHRACIWLVHGLYLACTILQVNMQTLQLLVGCAGAFTYTARNT